MVYLILKYVHTVAAVATISGFVLRGYWMLTESALLQRRDEVAALFKAHFSFGVRIHDADSLLRGN